LNAWLASPSHKANIEGNHTHFGIAIKENPANGRKYYTIFCQNLVRVCFFKSKRLPYPKWQPFTFISI
jgi:hypothetical protein